MVKTRVIPLLLLKDGLLKKPVQFTQRPRTVANALSIARVFEARQVDELILLDIGCSERNENVNPEVVRSIADNLTVPFTCGGGIRSVDAMAELVAAGAEKITVNTAAIENQTIISDGAARLGRQCIVVSIDAKRHADGTYEVYSHNGTVPTGRAPIEWAKEVEAHGAGEILLNSIDRDGTMSGYDIPLIRAVADAVQIPLIAAGGAGDLSHFPAAVLKGHASAVAAGSIYFFRRTTPLMVKEAMSAAGIPVRIQKAVHAA